ncbi:hypothetical protein B0H11DRAFT_1904471 [Mycena galericulata]|nr:hypothetical protein B0H11DRAFT_1904471 [Mycena galericulata]
MVPELHAVPNAVCMHLRPQAPNQLSSFMHPGAGIAAVSQTRRLDDGNCRVMNGNTTPRIPTPTDSRFYLVMPMEAGLPTSPGQSVGMDHARALAVLRSEKPDRHGNDEAQISMPAPKSKADRDGVKRALPMGGGDRGAWATVETQSGSPILKSVLGRSKVGCRYTCNVSKLSSDRRRQKKRPTDTSTVSSWVPVGVWVTDTIWKQEHRCSLNNEVVIGR